MHASAEYTVRDVNVVPAASLLAEPTRAAMLTAMLDDRPLAAGELARLAGVTPATASAHLARLLDGGLVTVIRQGRASASAVASWDWRRLRTGVTGLRCASASMTAAISGPASR